MRPSPVRLSQLTCDDHPGRLSSPPEHKNKEAFMIRVSLGDVPNYTNIPLQVQISEIVG